jgi:hypothetical protein
LQEIASRGGHIAQLLRSPGQNCTAEQRIAALDPRVVGEIGIGNQCADAQPAVTRLLDLVEGQPRDVDQP